MSNTTNPYQVLGVPDRSDIKVCQKAYRKLALKYHPDLCKDVEKSKRMVLINKCMEFLKDPQKKAQLDAPQPQVSYTITYTYGSTSTSGSWR